MNYDFREAALYERSVDLTEYVLKSYNDVTLIKHAVSVLRCATRALTTQNMKVKYKKLNELKHYLEQLDSQHDDDLENLKSHVIKLTNAHFRKQTDAA
ncbi:hypothetical protein [Alkalibacillus salilacus]|uniref:Uncharacterized protein n=1 Tax=Alkalibacillus salilacus TaxID=284582 RepID=A0ABT9VID7_9BACI|nr:hypothetical protein [Alkalibacillus salilacus]MDQ0160736.1 hypothetical protein [Alkalibacillus salilacus]